MKNGNKEDLSNPGSFPCRIIIKFQDDLQLPYAGTREINDFFLLEGVFKWHELLKTFPGITINKLFTSIAAEEINELVQKARVSDSGYKPPDFLTYYYIDCSTAIIATNLLQLLQTEKNIETVYIECDATAPGTITGRNDELSAYQGYLNAAPDGINAHFAWQIKGGNGEGNVKFVDIEQGWILDQENVSVSPLAFNGINHGFKEHGAAVLRLIMMDSSETGRKGITSKVKGHVMSQWRPDGSLNNADAIMTAIVQLNYGDIILLEAQARDSVSSWQLWPVEIHDVCFEVIRLASALGIIVIEAAGNGAIGLSLGNDLDRFALGGKKILNRLNSGFRDSGSIVVSAATNTVPHARTYNSNYGSRIDCYAWGEKVATAPSFPGSSDKSVHRYASDFGGTSSAAAIIAGAAIAVQSITEANYGLRLGPKQMRNILSNELYGTLSENGRSADKIGVMPDLKKIIEVALPAYAAESALAQAWV